MNIYASMQPNILNGLLFVTIIGSIRSLTSDRDLLVDQNLLVFSCGANSVIELMGRAADDFLFPEKLNIYCSLEPWDKCSVGGR